DPAGLRLDGGGAADLAAVAADMGVVGHVLRLERGDAEAVLAEDAAERRDEGGLAHPAGAALDHDGRHKRKKGAVSTQGSCTQFASFPGRRAALLRGSVYIAQAGLLAPG